LAKVLIPLPDCDEGIRLHQGNYFIDLFSHFRARGGRRGWNGHDEARRLLQSQRTRRRYHRRAGGNPVVDHENDFPANLRRNLVPTVGEFATLELPFLSGNDFVDYRGRDSEAVNDIFVQDADATRGDCAEGEFLVTGHPELAYHENINGRANSPCDSERDRHAAPRQPEHQHIIAARVLDELLGQQLSGLGSISKDFIHRRETYPKASRYCAAFGESLPPFDGCVLQRTDERLEECRKSAKELREETSTTARVTKPRGWNARQADGRVERNEIHMATFYLSGNRIEPLSVAQNIAARLGEIERVAAVALGGSWARGAAGTSSDLDLAIYYLPSDPPSIELLRRLACELHSDNSPPEVTEFGEWGPWVNGGAWLRIRGLKVDWLYRDLDRVSNVIDDCTRGVTTCDYYLGHPHAFHNHIYLAETRYCHPLHDPFEVLGELKKRVSVYPVPLKRALVTKFLYDADFMLELARPTALRGDVFHVLGCLFRCAAALVQVLFALNESYFMNEKGSVNAADSFSIKPPAFSSRVRAILASPGQHPSSLQARLDEMAALIAETHSLAKELAQPQRPGNGC
jgi:predicted nucleotidyltransferase